MGDTGITRHGLAEGDLIQISGTTGDNQGQWNRIYSVYDVADKTFKIARGGPFAAPSGNQTIARVTLLFDRFVQESPPNARINLGPGVFLTRGFATKSSFSVQPKSGWKIVGMGVEVTTIQLVGAGRIKDGGELIEPHYHAIGMPIEPALGSSPIEALQNFEIYDLTIDANTDNQPLRGQDSFPPVACGAIRVLGNHCRIRRVKAINWGTKTKKHGCWRITTIRPKTKSSKRFPSLSIG